MFHVLIKKKILMKKKITAALRRHEIKLGIRKFIPKQNWGQFSV